MKNLIIKALGGFTKEEFNRLVLEESGRLQHSVNLPEYREVKTGKLHLHSCSRGVWFEGKCVENNKGDYQSEMEWLKARCA